MALKEYFSEKEGTGVLSTADKEGKVDAAIYARPHVLEGGQVAFIMPDRLTHRNLQTNPYAAYLFVESGNGYNGKRLYLKKIGEEKDTERLYSLMRRNCPSEDSRKKGRFLVSFAIEKELPLVGDSS